MTSNINVLLWKQHIWRLKPDGLLTQILPHPAAWQIPQEYDPAYLVGVLGCVHGFESDYRMAARVQTLTNIKHNIFPYNVLLFSYCEKASKQSRMHERTVIFACLHLFS